MIQLLLLLGALSGVFAENNLFDLPEYPGLRVRFGYTPSIGKTYYFDIPRDNLDAYSQGWRRYTRPEGGPEGLASLKLYCQPEQLSFCVLYDDTYNIAGIQHALDKARFEDAVFDFEEMGFSEWTVDGKTYWATTQYFVDEAYLKRSRSDRASSRTSNTLQLDGIWVTTINKSLLHVPNTPAALVEAGFVKQECVQGQGLHYLYDGVTSNSQCSTWFPWVPIVYNDTLTGCIFAAVGRMPALDNEKYYFEDITPYALKASLPDIPDCYVNLATSNGVLAIHDLYFGNPWTVTCSPRDGTP